MMTYEQAREFINESARSGIVPGLENIKRLCDCMGNPQNALPTIHIGGTNGKGSVGAYLASVLMQSGLRVGRYTSPAVMCEREIFSINGEPVSEHSYAVAVSRAYDAAMQMKKQGLSLPTQFEIETAAAFACFVHEKCDIALIEVGMGGALDATNVIEKPLLSVFAHISMDHMAFLGDTIEKITAEKSGIIKHDTPVVSAGQELISMQILENKCRTVNSEIYYADTTKIISSSLDGTEFLCGGEKYKTTMCAAYQCDNAAVAIKCVQLLRSMGYEISDTDITRGIENAVWHGRFEPIRKNPPFIIDGAHNPDAAARLAESIRLYFGAKKPCMIFGVFADKAYDEIARLTTPLGAKIYTVAPPSARGLSADILCETVKKYNPDCVCCKDIDHALSLCADYPDGVVCFGSLSFLSEIKNKL